MSAYLPGQASYLAVLRPFEVNDTLAPLTGASFPSWLSEDGRLNLNLPESPLTTVLEQRITVLRTPRMNWARDALHLDEVDPVVLEQCPPCGQPKESSTRSCDQRRLCPYCYGRYNVEELYRDLAALVELMWADDQDVYVALDATQVYLNSDGSFPSWDGADARLTSGIAAESLPLGLIATFRPDNWFRSKEDRQSFWGGARVFCPLPTPQALDTEDVDVPLSPWPFLNVRMLRVHAAEPRSLRFPRLSPVAEPPHLVRKVESLADLVPLVAATCEFPAWWFNLQVPEAALLMLLNWLRGRQLRVNYGGLCSGVNVSRLFAGFARNNPAHSPHLRQIKEAIYSRYDYFDLRPADAPGMRQIVEEMARKLNILQTTSRKSAAPPPTTGPTQSTSTFDLSGATYGLSTLDDTDNDLYQWMAPPARL